ncbi:hypothetical protein J7K44_01965, partial [bacterium]|nr:hypothetical protein [bacterium]
MKNPFTFFKKNKTSCLLVLDIGTEAVKAVTLKKKDKEWIILGVALEYFEKFGVFDSVNFQQEVLKRTISKVIERILPQNVKKPISTFLALPPDILKGEINCYNFERKNYKKVIDRKEEKEILNNLLEKNKKEIVKT